jgi:hypothetical protein
LINTLPSNGSVYNKRELVFCAVRAEQKNVARHRSGKHSRMQQQKNGVFYVVRTETVTMQRGKYAYTKIRAVFSTGSVLRSYLEDN